MNQPAVTFTPKHRKQILCGQFCRSAIFLKNMDASGTAMESEIQYWIAAVSALRPFSEVVSELDISCYIAMDVWNGQW